VWPGLAEQSPWKAAAAQNEGLPGFVAYQAQDEPQAMQQQAAVSPAADQGLESALSKLAARVCTAAELIAAIDHATKVWTALSKWSQGDSTRQRASGRAQELQTFRKQWEGKAGSIRVPDGPVTQVISALRDAMNAAADELESQPDRNIASFLADTSDWIDRENARKPCRTRWEMPTRKRGWTWWLWALLIAMAIGGTGYYLYRRRKRR